MIIDKEIKIKLYGSNFKHLKELGYKNLKTGDEISIPINHLSKSSHLIINVKCDICEKEKQISHKTYNKNIKNTNIYCCCEKCSKVKNKKTCLDKYNNENYRNIEKNKETRLKKYDDENYNNLEKNKETCLRKYGCENVFQNKEIRELANKTIFEKYGVINVMQNENIFIKQQKNNYSLKQHHNGLNYRGNYEKHFLDFCFENNIKIEKGKTIKYIFNEKEHYYFSDFYYEPLNLIIEIKSKYTYNVNLNINILKGKYTIDSGYNYLFIIDKNYIEFIEIIKKSHQN